jgi:hypothetical protein
MSESPLTDRERAEKAEAERDEWKRRAEMVLRQRDAADRRANKMQAILDEVGKLARIDQPRARGSVGIYALQDALRGEKRSSSDVITELFGRANCDCMERIAPNPTCPMHGERDD